MAQSKPKAPKQTKRRLIVLGITAAALYVVIPQLGSFSDSFNAIRHAQPNWFAVAILAAPVSYLAATGIYLLLAQKRLSFGPTFIVQLATNFSNRLLPAGIGAIGTNYQYLRKNNHAPAEAAAVVATNNILGFVGNTLLVLGLVAVTSAGLDDIHWPAMPVVAYYIAAALLVVFLAFWLTKRGRKLKAGVMSILANISVYQRRPGRLLAALLVSMGLTACFALALYACQRAIGLDVSFTTVLIIMSIGVAGGAVTPTPGGLGGVEAGLVAGFVLYGISSSEALAAALLYRLLTYWLALILGSIAFVYAGQKQYI